MTPEHKEALRELVVWCKKHKTCLFSHDHELAVEFLDEKGQILIYYSIRYFDEDTSKIECINFMQDEEAK